MKQAIQSWQQRHEFIVNCARITAAAAELVAITSGKPVCTVRAVGVVSRDRQLLGGRA